MAGRSMPGSRPRFNKADATTAPVLPAETTADAAAVLHQAHRDVDCGVALLTHGLHRRFAHAYRLAGLDDVQAGRLRRVSGKLALYQRARPDERDLQAELARRLHGAGNRFARCAVAAQGIERDDHASSAPLANRPR